MKEKIQRFMMGRYGADALNKFLFGVTLALLVASILFDSNFFKFTCPVVTRSLLC